ncbi:MAG: c-type cytochrome [Defluviicoccus sp.]|nr:c-type cytochrome [Defluviicoccus sp.]MDE0384231.1 c-type cytochrome [Defluviicoccus sp.]
MRVATLLAGAFALTLAASMGAAFTPGDPVKGEKAFKKCKTCHSVVPGKKMATGPNLLGVFGRQAGTVEFKFGKSMVEAGEAGLTWTPEAMDAYIKDPKGFLKKTLGASKVRNKMKYKMKKAGQRADVIAYLMSLQD